MVLLRSLLIAGVCLTVSPPLAASAPLKDTVGIDNLGTKHWPEVSWGPCEARFVANVTCATLQVPLDWEQPSSSENITLGIMRLKARKPASRIGYLFINPGGPGGQASELINGMAARPNGTNPEVLDRFDIIGVDPRGVGLSTPVQCDVKEWNRRVSLFPNTKKEFDALVTKNKLISYSCRKKSGRLIDFVDTVSAAKDHEAVRIALRDGKASFLGLSYGTERFSSYAELFPHNIRALLLDGAVQHSQSEYSNLLIESSTYEATLRHFFAWCKTTKKDCVLSDKDVEQTLVEILQKANKTPVPAPGCANSTRCRPDVIAEEVLFATQSFLLSTEAWPALAIAFKEAQSGNATLLSSRVQLASGNAYDDSLLFAAAAIQCQDWTHSDTEFYQLKERQIMAKTMTPLTMGVNQFWQLQASCIGWKARQTNPEKRFTYWGNQTALVVHSIWDPSTSYTWALGFQRELKNAVLLTRNGSGHTSWSMGGETSKRLDAYLVNLTLPEPGSVLDT